MVKLRDGHSQGWFSAFMFTRIICIAYLLSRMRKQNPPREHNSLLSNIKAISYISACISIQCPTVGQILIKLHHSEEKEWSSLSSGGWNDFISRLVVWWMMKCWPKNQKRTNKTKQQTRLEYPKDSQWRRKKEIDILSTVFVCFAVNLLRICPHILIEGKLHMSYVFEDICHQHCSPETSPFGFVCLKIKYLYLFCPFFGRIYNITTNRLEWEHHIHHSSQWILSCSAGRATRLRSIFPNCKVLRLCSFNECF